jgi:hypothetical protein
MQQSGFMPSPKRTFPMHEIGDWPIVRPKRSFLFPEKVPRGNELVSDKKVGSDRSISTDVGTYDIVLSINGNQCMVIGFVNGVDQLPDGTAVGIVTRHHQGMVSQ